MDRIVIFTEGVALCQGRLWSVRASVELRRIARFEWRALAQTGWQSVACLAINDGTLARRVLFFNFRCEWHLEFEFSRVTFVGCVSDCIRCKSSRLGRLQLLSCWHCKKGKRSTSQDRLSLSSSFQRLPVTVAIFSWGLRAPLSSPGFAERRRGKSEPH